MPVRNHNYLVPLTVVGSLVGVSLLGWWLTRQPTPSPPAVITAPDPRSSWPLSMRTLPPWDTLIQPVRGPSAVLQEALSQLYAPTAPWPQWVRFDEAGSHFRRTDGPAEVTVKNDSSWHTPTRYWRRATEMPRTAADQPLSGVKITIDPGHIGGEWAQLEERWFQIDDQHLPVMEGELTLTVAKILKPRLEACGAIVTLVREKNEPVTAARPDHFLQDNRSLSAAQKMFYRTAEIHARAEKINEVLRPDLVLCLHFNAEAWGNPQQPAFVDGNHFHLIVNGHYLADELSYDDVRAAMAIRLIERVHEEEIALADIVSYAMAASNHLPPYDYQVEHQASPKTHRPLPHNPYVWARNLLANRVYRCPVVFCEPYVMNNRTVYQRIAAGDYEGQQMIDGQLYPSIFREYADGLLAGLVQYYDQKRPAPRPPS